MAGGMAKRREPAGTPLATLMPPNLRCLPPEPLMSEALPREVNTAVDLAALHECVNDAMG